MPCDALWILRKKKGEFCLRTRGNEKYFLEKYTNYVNTYFIDSTSNRKAINHQNTKDRKDRGYMFMRTHDKQKEKLGTS
jgi:hypothetical protein